MNVPSELIRQLPNLDNLLKQLKQDPESIILRTFWPEDSNSSTSEADPQFEVGSLGNKSNTLEDITQLNLDELSELTIRTVEKVCADGETADLNHAEQSALEAIVLRFGRPALFIQNGRLQSDLEDEWKHLDTKREFIEAIFPSVGRIELRGHVSLDWVGTGFLVAENTIMTNRHVAFEFCQRVRGRWRLQPAISARIDYIKEYGALTSTEFVITRVIGFHDVHDLALLKVEQVSGHSATPPKPLMLASEPPSSFVDHEICVVGYPAWDGRRNDPDIMQRIFQKVYNFKRCQPGKITKEPNSSVFTHDCSTLGGNSGSCVVDLESYKVIGLHFGGQYLRGNVSVALWELINDPLLKRAKINWH